MEAASRPQALVKATVLWFLVFLLLPEEARSSQHRCHVTLSPSLILPGSAVTVQVTGDRQWKTQNQSHHTLLTFQRRKQDKPALRVPAALKTDDDEGTEERRRNVRRLDQPHTPDQTDWLVNIPTNIEGGLFDARLEALQYSHCRLAGPVYVLSADDIASVLLLEETPKTAAQITVNLRASSPLRAAAEGRHPFSSVPLHLHLRRKPSDLNSDEAPISIPGQLAGLFQWVFPLTTSTRLPVLPPFGHTSPLEGLSVSLSVADSSFVDVGLVGSVLERHSLSLNVETAKDKRALQSCSAGYEASGGSCVACSAGTYSAAAGDSCSSCNAGTFAASSGATSCTECPAGAFANSTGSSSCTECYPGSYSADTGNVRCSKCQMDFYAPVGGSESCLTCASGAICDSTGTVLPATAANYFRYGPDTDPLYLKCPVKGACLGEEENECYKGSTGFLCGSCEENYERWIAPLKCQACPATTIAALVIVAGFAAYSLMIWYLSKEAESAGLDKNDITSVVLKSILNYVVLLAVVFVAAPTSYPKWISEIVHAVELYERPFAWLSFGCLLRKEFAPTHEILSKAVVAFIFPVVAVFLIFLAQFLYSIIAPLACKRNMRNHEISCALPTDLAVFAEKRATVAAAAARAQALNGRGEGEGDDDVAMSVYGQQSRMQSFAASERSRSFSALLADPLFEQQGEVSESRGRPGGMGGFQGLSDAQYAKWRRNTVEDLSPSTRQQLRSHTLQEIRRQHSEKQQQEEAEEELGGEGEGEGGRANAVAIADEGASINISRIFSPKPRNEKAPEKEKPPETEEEQVERVLAEIEATDDADQHSASSAPLLLEAGRFRWNAAKRILRGAVPTLIILFFVVGGFFWGSFHAILFFVVGGFFWGSFHAILFFVVGGFFWGSFHAILFFVVGGFFWGSFHAILFFVVHPIINVVLADTLACKYYEEVDRTVHHNDSELDCRGETYRRFLPLVYSGIAIWGFGIPLAAYAILFFNRHHLQSTWCRLQFGFLYNGYQLRFYYWECVIMAREVLVHYLLVLDIEYESKLTLFVVVGLILVTLQAAANPFDSRAYGALNTLEMLSLWCFTISAIGNLFWVNPTGNQNVDIALMVILVGVSNLLYLLYAAGLLFGGAKFQRAALGFSRMISPMTWLGMCISRKQREIKVPRSNSRGLLRKHSFFDRFTQRARRASDALLRRGSKVGQEVSQRGEGENQNPVSPASSVVSPGDEREQMRKRGRTRSTVQIKIEPEDLEAQKGGGNLEGVDLEEGRLVEENAEGACPVGSLSPPKMQVLSLQEGKGEAESSSLKKAGGIAGEEEGVEETGERRASGGKESQDESAVPASSPPVPVEETGPVSILREKEVGGGDFQATASGPNRKETFMRRATHAIQQTADFVAGYMLDEQVEFYDFGFVEAMTKRAFKAVYERQVAIQELEALRQEKSKWSLKHAQLRLKTFMRSARHVLKLNKDKSRQKSRERHRTKRRPTAVLDAVNITVPELQIAIMDLMYSNYPKAFYQNALHRAAQKMHLESQNTMNRAPSFGGDATGGGECLGGPSSRLGSRQQSMHSMDRNLHKSFTAPIGGGQSRRESQQSERSSGGKSMRMASSAMMKRSSLLRGPGGDGGTSTPKAPEQSQRNMMRASVSFMEPNRAALSESLSGGMHGGQGGYAGSDSESSSGEELMPKRSAQGGGGGVGEAVGDSQAPEMKKKEEVETDQEEAGVLGMSTTEVNDAVERVLTEM
uniref:Uncharacterized protein n=1 Tax=Chromera velia CCMP2878 TaxID=1169474 RepID=A0A0G4F1Q1_9ALVE|eukprot:Cvel_14651.t1-p1 / transcript=Cvel_14651.t1 / gene=Cvel_14651 / organism=Chromera_velia_CCMP2878 / gene_product=Signal peptide, CUB and EGF-like domain-containing, putative / transcript_product=Signal peptide, CUB and EGF-like domain-containing, putative / location=Cvel_scaffold1049:33461-47774(+) / protein_length=1736 / sequence_SO=supercontig / SO=protein_coding / is_pseudo=false